MGIQEGMQKGEQKGRQAGRQEGMQEGMQKIIDLLRSGKSPEEIIRGFSY
jgi:predicted transposase YdaD